MIKNDEMPKIDRTKKVCTAEKADFTTEPETYDMSEQDFWMQVSRLDNL